MFPFKVEVFRLRDRPPCPLRQCQIYSPVGSTVVSFLTILFLTISRPKLRGGQQTRRWARLPRFARFLPSLLRNNFAILPKTNFLTNTHDSRFAKRCSWGPGGPGPLGTLGLPGVPSHGPYWPTIGPLYTHSRYTALAAIILASLPF